MSVVVSGVTPMGRIERVAGASVVTRFWILNGLPLSARESFIDLGPARGVIPIPLNRRSVAAGYLRVWALIFTACAGLASMFVPLALIAFLPLAALSAYAWIFLGVLSPAAVRRRLAYATWTGAPFDPADLDARADVPSMPSLIALVDERTAQAPVGYRGTRTDAWRDVAAVSDDPQLLIAALTRARLERRGQDAAGKAEMDAIHAAIWAKLEPMLVAGNAPRAYLDWAEHAARESSSSQVDRKRLVAAAVAVAVTVVLAVPVAQWAMRPQLAIANLSEADGLTVQLDGKQVAHLVAARREGDAAFTRIRVVRGTHELVARDASGTEIDRRQLVVSDDSRAFVYTPGRAPKICLFSELAYYSAGPSGAGYGVVPLDMSSPLVKLSESVDVWFGELPRTVQVSENAPRAERRSVRAWRCDIDLRNR